MRQPVQRDMPGANGLDFQVHLEKLGNQIPIIFMTGYGDIPMTVRAVKAGAAGFHAKPFRDQDILDAVSVALQKDSEITIKLHRSNVMCKMDAHSVTDLVRKAELLGL